MDNLTHSLIGISAGECFYQVQQKPLSKLKLNVSRSTIIFASVIANNFPDLDILFEKLMKPPLGYLLQHRGFTHTFVAAIPQALLVMALTFLVSRLGKTKLQLRDLAWIFLIGVVGVALHIFADSLNSYGVHPFWPFNNKWYYGDSVFIAEPWIWITLAPSLFWLSQTKLGRILSAGLALLAFGVTFYSHIVPLVIGLGMVAWYLGLFCLLSLVSESRAGFTGFAIFLFTIELFLMGGRVAKNQIRDIAWQNNPESKLYDTIVSPMPANFLCWYVVLVESYGKPETYKLSSGFFSASPLRVPPESCARFPYARKGRDIKFLSKKPNQDPRISWMQSFKTPAQKIRDIYEKDCRVQAFFKFARAPFVLAKGDDLIMGDYRYERPDVPGFSRMDLKKTPIECPRYVPPWIPPRTDFLNMKF